ncbi:MAG: hypothetical protein IJY17_10375 [Alphaproteobacteria bacterium]|nr:hypothetical protein [Alphaproteobacteria bacterium]
MLFRQLKKYVFCAAALCAGGILAACQGDIRAGRPMVQMVRPTSLPTEPKTTRSAEMVSLESPMRCTVHETQQNIMTVIPFKQEAFKLERADKSDPLPRYEVTGFSFDGQTAERVFYKLLNEAKIKVVAEGGPFPELAAENITGELSEVMNMIADAADIYYRYNDQQKVLIISREVNWNFYIPDKREVMIAVLDSLRGAGIHDLIVNWEESVISFKGDKQIEEKVKKLIELFDTEPKLIVFDVQVLRVKPYGATKEIVWQELVDIFGADRIKFMLKGVMGRALVTDYDINPKSLRNFLNARGSVTQVSEGMFIAANKWRARFDVGRCGYMSMPEAQLSIMAQTELYGERRMNTAVTLDSDQGEITAFTAKSRLGDNIVLIGIPSASFSDSLNGYETVVILTPSIIKLVKEFN